MEGFIIASNREEILRVDGAPPIYQPVEKNLELALGRLNIEVLNAAQAVGKLDREYRSALCARFVWAVNMWAAADGGPEEI